MRNKCFTLIEVLITITIIGVVAAITIPALVTNITERIKQNKITVIQNKLNKGTSLLSTQNGIGPYYGETKEGTRLFLNELSKHMKIINMCDKTNITSCIPYDKVNKSTGGTKPVLDYMTDDGSGVGMFDSYSHKFGQVMGVIFGDGTTMILTYDLKCPISDPDSRNDNPTECLHGWYDLNGPKGPNKWGKDIVGFNYGYGKTYKAGNDNCVETRNTGKYGIRYCHSGYKNDYWTGAAKKCNGISNMLSQNELAALAALLYSNEDGSPLSANDITETKTNISNRINMNIKENIIYNEYSTKILSTLGISSSNFTVWAGEDYSGNGGWAYTRHFTTNQTYSYLDDRGFSSSIYTICKGD